MFENMPGGGNGAAAPQVVTRGPAPAADGEVKPGATAVASAAGADGDGDAPDAVSIAGISALKGIILYGATLTFASLYGFFITRILGAKPGHPPKLDGVMVSTAAALAGVLGSAFALEIGTTPAKGQINHGLGTDLGPVDNGSSTPTQWAKARIRQVFSLEPAGPTRASWPKTFGILPTSSIRQRHRPRSKGWPSRSPVMSLPWSTAPTTCRSAATPDGGAVVGWARALSAERIIALPCPTVPARRACHGAAAWASQQTP
jgi:hypothetical protein